MSKKLDEQLRGKYVELLKNWLGDAGEEVLQTKSNEIAIPTLDAEGNDSYVLFVVKVPTGDRDGEPYEAYELAEEYKTKVAEKEEKAKVAEKKKQEKIRKDEEARRIKAEAKAKARKE